LLLASAYGHSDAGILMELDMSPEWKVASAGGRRYYVTPGQRDRVMRMLGWETLQTR
jgi:hypothetical protein